MEELIFFGILILFSILESISRRRKAKARGDAEEPGELEAPEWQPHPPWEDELPTYDADGSYDDAAEEVGPRPDRARSGSAADLWAELAGLATGTHGGPEARTRSIPRQSPPLPDSPPVEARQQPVLSERQSAVPRRLARHPLEPVATEAEHPVHRAHLGFGTDPSSRAPSEQDVLAGLPPPRHARSVAVRAQLRSHKASQLREAILLKEVLEPPVALRD